MALLLSTLAALMMQAAPNGGLDLAPASPDLSGVQRTMQEISDQIDLNIIFVMPFPNRPAYPGGPFRPDGDFESWAPVDRASVPGEVVKTCKRMWDGARQDNPFRHGRRFLPDAQSQSDENELGADLCVVAHMPADWPERAKFIDAYKLIFARAAALGGKLHAPSGAP